MVMRDLVLFGISGDDRDHCVLSAPVFRTSGTDEEGTSYDSLLGMAISEFSADVVFENYFDIILLWAFPGGMETKRTIPCIVSYVKETGQPGVRILQIFPMENDEIDDLMKRGDWLQ